MLLIWGQKWGRYRRYYYGLPLRRNLKPRTYAGFLNLWRFGPTSTVWFFVGILSPQRCVSLRPQAERRTPQGRARFKLNISASPKCFY